MSRESYRFLCDENVNRKSVAAMRRRGIDAVHVLELDMMSAADHEVLATAIEEDRILITRDYSDFSVLVANRTMQEHAFPGVLLISPSIPEGDVGALVHAVEAWVHSSESNLLSIRNSAAWLILPDKDPGFEQQVREAVVPYLSALVRIS
ncbi:DUF5615 family PIN-like protein [Gemmatimonadota bacterium]